jgi:hypothetical protein
MPIASMPSSMGCHSNQDRHATTAGKSRPSHRPTDAARRKAGSTHTTGKCVPPRRSHRHPSLHHQSRGRRSLAGSSQGQGAGRRKGGYCDICLLMMRSPGYRTRPPICSIIKKGTGLCRPRASKSPSASSEQEGGERL